MEVKECTDCKESFPATEEHFYLTKRTSKKKGTFYELTAMCRECLRRRARQYRYDNLEDVKAYEKKKYQKRKEYYKENNKRYYEEKGEKKRALTRKWLKTERGKTKLKEYQKDRKENKEHQISKEEWLNCKNFFDNCCAYCGLHVDDHFVGYNKRLMDLHKDHLYHEGRNDIKNCIPACQTCNSSKGTYTLNQWYNPTNSNYTFEKYYKIYLWIRYEAKKIAVKKKPKRKHKKRNTARSS